MDARVSFDVSVGETFLRFAGLAVERGDVHHALGHMAMRWKDDIERMYRLAGQAIDPGRAQNVMREGDKGT